MILNAMRDELAAQSLLGDLARTSSPQVVEALSEDARNRNISVEQYLASGAYFMANTMLKTRKDTP